MRSYKEIRNASDIPNLPEWSDELYEDWYLNFGTEVDTKEKIKERYDEVKKKLEYFYNQGRVKLFRMVVVSEMDEIIFYKIGISWTYLKEEARVYSDMPGDIYVLLIGEAPVDSIDWEHTLYMLLADPLEDEAEITLKSGSLILIKELEINGELKKLDKPIKAYA